MNYPMRAFCALCCTLFSAGAFAGQPVTEPATSTPATMEGEDAAKAPSPWVLSSDLEAGYSYAGKGDADHHQVNEQIVRGQYVLNAQYGDGPPLRLGAEWQTIAFSDSGARLPNTLQQQVLIASIDFQVLSNIFIRVEADPGLYNASSRVYASAFAVPVIVGGSYLYNKDLQLVLGISIDYNRYLPVLPGGGIRWQIMDKLLLDAVLPKPRIEYEISKKSSLYVGADVEESTYRTDNTFDGAFHRGNLKGKWVDYYEIRTGGGAMVKVNDKVTLDVNTGYIIHRSFSYHRSEFDFATEGVGFYAGVSLTAKF